MKLVRTAERFDPLRGRLETWVLLTARSLAIDGLRRRVREARSLHAVGVPREDDPSPGPEEMATVADLSSRARRAMAVLSAEQRSALELAYFGGRTTAEVAALEGIPQGTVKTRNSARPCCGCARRWRRRRIMTCEEVRELLPEHLLSALDETTDMAVRRHLRGCAACREERMKLEEGVAALSHAVHEEDPPEELRARVLRALDEEWEEPGPVPAAPRPPTPSHRRSVWTAVAAAIGARARGGIDHLGGHPVPSGEPRDGQRGQLPIPVGLPRRQGVPRGLDPTLDGVVRERTGGAVRRRPHEGVVVVGPRDGEGAGVRR